MSAAMNIQEAIEEACKKPTLVDALAWIAIWETERVVEQVREFDRTGISTAAQGRWDTCFKWCFDGVLKEFGGRNMADRSECAAESPACEHHWQYRDTAKHYEYLGYNTVYSRVDFFYCTRCLENKKVEQRAHAREAPDWYHAK